MTQRTAVSQLQTAARLGIPHEKNLCDKSKTGGFKLPPFCVEGVD